MGTQRRRLDVELVRRGLVPSRTRAVEAIDAGRVLVAGSLALTPARQVAADEQVSITAVDAEFVSRGGHKLARGLDAFAIDVGGRNAVDVGASTGGFTDCLLQRGAARVFAVDVGRGQLAWKLRRDPRVVVMEKTNARELTPAKFPHPFTPVDLVVIDCSFISLRKILPAAIGILREARTLVRSKPESPAQAPGKILALIKPQFEAGKREADRGAGVIRDAAIHQRVLGELEKFVASQAGLRWAGVTESPLRGPAGNKEFLALIEKIG